MVITRATVLVKGPDKWVYLAKSNLHTFVADFGVDEIIALSKFYCGINPNYFCTGGVGKHFPVLFRFSHSCLIHTFVILVLTINISPSSLISIFQTSAV